MAKRPRRPIRPGESNVPTSVKPKKIRDTLRAIDKTEGWTVQLRNGGHIKVTAPDGRSTFVSGSGASYGHAVKEALADLHRIGWPKS